MDRVKHVSDSARGADIEAVKDRLGVSELLCGARV
jgi:hypothetical protein